MDGFGAMPYNQKNISKSLSKYGLLQIINFGRKPESNGIPSEITRTALLNEKSNFPGAVLLQLYQLPMDTKTYV